MDVTKENYCKFEKGFSSTILYFLLRCLSNHTIVAAAAVVVVFHGGRRRKKAQNQDTMIKPRKKVRLSIGRLIVLHAHIVYLRGMEG